MGIVVKKAVVKKASSGVAKVKTHKRTRKNGVSVVKQHTKKVKPTPGADGKPVKPKASKATPSKVAMPKKVAKPAKKAVATK
jgi:hypothetical protein